jgi:hypothetical protein
MPPTLRQPNAATLRTVLEAGELLPQLLAEGEPAPLHVLLGALDGAVARLAQEFPIVGAADVAPVPKGEGGAGILEYARRMAELVGARTPRLQGSSTHNTIIVLQDPLPTLRLGANLWNLGDELTLRGLIAVGFARVGLGAPRVRSLPPAAIDLLLAASFEVAEVFNPMTADPDPRQLAELVAQLRNLLPRRQRKIVEDSCKALATTAFDAGATARATRATDLRLATVLSADPAACLSAACALDGVLGGSLKQRINRSRAAQELLVHLLSDDFLGVAQAASLL